MTGVAVLFAMMARGEEQPEEKPTPVTDVRVVCWYCLSDHTEMLDHEHDIYRCLDCGEVFTRGERTESTS